MSLAMTAADMDRAHLVCMCTGDGMFVLPFSPDPYYFTVIDRLMQNVHTIVNSDFAPKLVLDICQFLSTATSGMMPVDQNVAV